MNPDRLNKLQQFLKEEPNDPFNLYAVATELATEDIEQAMPYFQKLLNDHPEYVATYYHAAAALTELDRLEEAKEVYEKGIRICEANNESFALRELKVAYQNFLFEFEDEIKVGS